MVRNYEDGKDVTISVSKTVLRSIMRKGWDNRRHGAWGGGPACPF